MLTKLRSFTLLCNEYEDNTVYCWDLIPLCFQQMKHFTQLNSSQGNKLVCYVLYSNKQANKSKHQQKKVKLFWIWKLFHFVSVGRIFTGAMKSFPWDHTIILGNSFSGKRLCRSSTNSVSSFKSLLATLRWNNIKDCSLSSKKTF